MAGLGGFYAASDLFQNLFSSGDLGQVHPGALLPGAYSSLWKLLFAPLLDLLITFTLVITQPGPPVWWLHSTGH